MAYKKWYIAIVSTAGDDVALEFMRFRRREKAEQWVAHLSRDPEIRPILETGAVRYEVRPVCSEPTTGRYRLRLAWERHRLAWSELWYEVRHG
jgi:hypothetical protein